MYLLMYLRDLIWRVHLLLNYYLLIYLFLCMPSIAGRLFVLCCCFYTSTVHHEIEIGDTTVRLADRCASEFL